MPVAGSDLRMSARTLTARLRAVCRRAADDEGVILIVTVMMLPVVIGFIGLMLDGAMVLSDRRELQDAADAAALSGAMQLDLKHFADTGEWIIADTTSVPGTQTAHEAAQEVCLAYGVICTTDVQADLGFKVLEVAASGDTNTVFIHLLTGEPVVHLTAESSAIMAPGF